MKNRNVTFTAILFVLGCFALSSATQAAPSPSNVNVVNTPNVNVASASPITGGGGSYAIDAPCFSNCGFLEGARTASAISIHMTGLVCSVALLYQGNVVATFNGPCPGFGGHSDIDLPLTRPVKFDQITCTGAQGETCFVSFVGAEP